MRSQFFTLDTLDSLVLLLLIQNEGKGLVRVAISVPDFVQLEKKEKKNGGETQKNVLQN